MRTGTVVACEPCVRIWFDGGEVRYEGALALRTGGPLAKGGDPRVPHGRGRCLRDVEGAAVVVYDGEFEQGLPHGRGRYTFRDGATYDGEFRDGRRDGTGTFRSAHDETYAGEWAADERHGSCTERYADGSIKYVGAYRRNQRHGYGELTLPDGGTYRGDFAFNTYHGHGMHHAADGGIYEGRFCVGRRHGYGREFVRTGSTSYSTFYTGRWADDERHGHGVELARWSETFAVRYVGAWRDGRRCGRGIEYVQGTCGRRCGCGGLEYHKAYDGEWDEGRRHGQGTEFLHHGRVRYAGRWERGVASADGKRKREEAAERRRAVAARRRREAIAALHRDGVVPPVAKCAVCFEEMHHGAERYVYNECGHLALCGGCRARVTDAACILCKTPGRLVRLYDA